MGNVVPPDEIATAEADLIYLHGFNSSPRSVKARQTVSWCRARCPGLRLHIPDLSHEPARAIADLEALITQCQASPDQSHPTAPRIGLIGSSLGGFYATWLAERRDLRAALVNPAVRPWELCRGYLGVNRNLYTGRRYRITPEHIEQLRSLDCPELSRPDKILLLVQTADETLDYQQAVEKYAHSACIIRDGGSHSYENYPAELPAILTFLFEEY